jgi:hypothetical protein
MKPHFFIKISSIYYEGIWIQNLYKNVVNLKKVNFFIGSVY